MPVTASGATFSASNTSTTPPGILRSVSRFAAWLMIVSLISIQAHDLVPHHHHADAAPNHWHESEGHAGLDLHAAHGTQLGDSHPEIAPHDEASLSTATTRHAQHVVMALPNPIMLVFPVQIRAKQRVMIAAEHPFATGPPGTKSSRAPPASLTA